MKIVIKRAGHKPERTEIKGDLHEMQKIVDGHIECIMMTKDICCVLNEEGKFRGLEPNFRLGLDIIVGDVFFCRAGYEDFEGLTEEQENFIMNLFN